MIKIKIIKGIINVSSKIQTTLINYLEFRQTKPREMKEKGYEEWKAPPKKPYEVEKPFQKEDVVKPHYSILLALANERGNPIKSVIRKRVTPLRTKAKYCRKCKAPKEYLLNHGFYTRKSSGEKFPKHTCKVCYAEYAPKAARKKPKHICPYCGYAMNPQNYRKNFTVYFCCQKECPHLELHPERKRYNEREWHFDYDKLETREIQSTKSIERIRLPKQIFDIEMSLFIDCAVTARDTVKILQKLYGKEIIKSHQSIFNHAEALASFVEENEDVFPTPLSDEVCEDETYVKYFGRWGYLFRAFNPEGRNIIAEHFSVHRDTKGAITLNKKVTEKYLKNMMDPEYKLISDQAPIYPAAIDYMESKNKAHIEHFAIKGIFDEPDEKCSEYRGEKQMIERSFESLKSGIKRRRRFGSLKGARTFCFLHKLFYNHLRPHENLNNSPPVPLYLKSGKQVSNWNEILQYIAEKHR
jgi:transposase-like protein